MIQPASSRVRFPAVGKPRDPRRSSPIVRTLRKRCCSCWIGSTRRPSPRVRVGQFRDRAGVEQISHRNLAPGIGLAFEPPGSTSARGESGRMRQILGPVTAEQMPEILGSDHHHGFFCRAS